MFLEWFRQACNIYFVFKMQCVNIISKLSFCVKVISSLEAVSLFM